MKAVITIRSDKKNRYGQCPLVIQLNEGKVVARISLGHNVDPKYFNKVEQLVESNYFDHKVLNGVIYEAKKKIKEVQQRFSELCTNIFLVPKKTIVKFLKVCMKQMI